MAGVVCVVSPCSYWVFPFVLSYLSRIVLFPLCCALVVWGKCVGGGLSATACVMWCVWCWQWRCWVSLVLSSCLCVCCHTVVGLGGVFVAGLCYCGMVVMVCVWVGMAVGCGVYCLHAATWVVCVSCDGGV